MPFIHGRYHINPVMGQALEAARQAEAALAALEQRSRQNSGEDHSGADSYGDDATGFRSAQDAGTKGPVHRVEIEAAELVPNHSGRAQRGFVARIHRAPAAQHAPGNAGGDADDWRDPGSSSSARSSAPETQVFANHGDLVDFLRDALARDADR